MKKKQGKAAIETHDITAKRFARPGSDLGATPAIPQDFVPDVDGGGSKYNRRDQFTFVKEGTRGGKTC